MHLHPAPCTSTQLISASTQFSATPSTIFEPKYCTQLGNLAKFRSKNQKLSILTEDWHTWYTGGVDSESKHRFLKFRPQNPFLGKFGPKKSKVSVLLDFWNSDPKIHFWENLGPKSQRCLFCLKIGTHVISRMLILIPTLVFWISNPSFLFGQIWVKKVKVVHFNWKLAHLASWKCRFRIRT